ncbi:MAG TPA: ATP-binding protein, partial [Vicinamibacterales bacterium]|nr:ATP-binding protein [Vicinamibacterales bacterium]
SLAMELTAVPLGLMPLAFASAIVRYRLMDVEIILKRLLVYSAALSAIVAIYVVIVRATGGFFVSTEDDHRWVIAALATVVVLLLARPVKDAVQSAIDRVFYRDRYDYRRALVGFARELNTDLDLDRLAERLLSRVKDTLVVDRLCLMSGSGYGTFEAIRHDGFDRQPPEITRGSAVATRLAEGHVVRLDDPMAAARYPAEEVEFWRDAGLFYFVPCVSKGTSIAALALGRRDNGEPLTTEDVVLLTAMAGQVATSIENARLYRELHLKAAEFDRLRVFNEHILESLDDGLLVIGGDGAVVSWNHALERIYGLRRGEAVGRTLDSLFEPAVVTAVQAARAASPNGGTEYRVPLTGRGLQNGARLLVNVTTVPLLPMPGREWAGTIVMFEDVTVRAHLEEQLRVSERMASLGLLAAGVAHEVNTPLTGISSYTQMLLEQADPDDPRTKLLEKIERQTFRAARIVNGLLNLSRPSGIEDGDRAVVDLNIVAAEVLSLLEHQFDKGRVRVRRELAEAPVLVSGYEFKLQQVFLNLFLNARDAMPSGGWLTIVTRVDGDRAMAEVRDTGMGVSPEHLQRIYDPFFTTKGIGRGTGLGLSISYGIVQEHGGAIQCESAEGQGTTFILSFAAAGAEQPGRSRQQGTGV